MHKYVILSLYGLFATFTLFIIFYHAFNRDLLTSAGVMISAGFASVLSIFVLYRGTKFHGVKVDKTQIFLVIGIWLWFGAEIIFGYYQIWLKIEAPFPSLADPIYLSWLCVLYILFIPYVENSQSRDRARGSNPSFACCGSFVWVHHEFVFWCGTIDLC